VYPIEEKLKVNRLKSFVKPQIDPKTAQLLGIIAVIFIWMSILLPGRFATVRNITAMGFQFPEVGLLSIGIAMTMITAGADLSIVAVANLSAVVNAMILIQRMPQNADSSTIALYLFFCVVMTLLIGIVCGCINGFLIGKLKVFPILATLGTQNLFAGMAIILTGGIGVFGPVPRTLTFIGSGLILDTVPVPFVFFLVFLIIVYTLIHKTPYGLKTQWFGANRKASFYSGIDNAKTVFTTYLFSAIIGSCTGFLILARTASAKGDYGVTLVLQCLLVSVLGGVSPLGGKGNILNVFLAVISLQLIDTGFNFMRISTYVRASTYGGLLIISMVLEYALNKYRERRMIKASMLKEQQAV
jgi:simple sugar transport system permease protein